MTIKLFLSYVLIMSCSQKSEFKSLNLKSYNTEVFLLDDELNEISGLAVDNKDRIFTHNDEKGFVYQLSHDAKIIKKMQIGNPVLNEDFEGIAIHDTTFYLVTSNGDIYEFPEVEDGDISIYKKYKTSLKSKNNIEGLCYYPPNNSLLLITKDDPGIKGKYKKTIWEFFLGDKRLSKKPFLVLDVNKLRHISVFKEFSPSGIEYSASTNSFFIIAANGHSICEINNSGEILRAEKLGKGHKQVEGISFLTNGDLILSDEGKKGNALLHIYKKREMAE